jgi:hypothetical protein
VTVVIQEPHIIRHGKWLNIEGIKTESPKLKTKIQVSKQESPAKNNLQDFIICTSFGL